MTSTVYRDPHGTSTVKFNWYRGIPWVPWVPPIPTIDCVAWIILMLILYSKSEKIALSATLYGHLGVTYALHLWLVGKPAVDSIFVMQELFSLSPTVETLWAEINRSRRFLKGWVTLSADFRGKGALPTNHCWCQSSRVISDYPFCGINISAVRDLVLSQSTRVTDRRTELRLPRLPSHMLAR